MVHTPKLGQFQGPSQLQRTLWVQTEALAATSPSAKACSRSLFHGGQLQKSPTNCLQPNFYLQVCCCQGNPTCHRHHPSAGPGPQCTAMHTCSLGLQAHRGEGQVTGPTQTQPAPGDAAESQSRICLSSKPLFCFLRPTVFSYLIHIFIIALLAKCLNLQAEKNQACWRWQEHCV